MFDFLNNIIYWIFIKIFYFFIWSKYYTKKILHISNNSNNFNYKHINHKGSTYNIKINDITIYDSNKKSIIHDYDKEEIKQYINYNDNPEWFFEGDLILIDYSIDDTPFKIYFNKNNKNNKIVFPMYSNDELDKEWKSNDYKHSILVAEIISDKQTKDITDFINMFIGPMGDFYKSSSIEWKFDVNYLFDIFFYCDNNDWYKLEITDNYGNDYTFTRGDSIFMKKLNI